MHFGTFRLTYEGIEEPVEELIMAMDKHRVGTDSFDLLLPGETTALGVTFNVAGSR
jgi:hypothetical protein